jgi:pimeloyl-ACP methyl ester carboxylesterase
MSWAIASDGARLHYDVIGRKSAPPVLMIQGLGADKHLWDLQRFVLSTRYRVIAHDNRGAGRSDKPIGPYSLPQMADDAMAVLDHAGIENAIGGHPPSTSSAFAVAGVHLVQQSPMATRSAVVVG